MWETWIMHNVWLWHTVEVLQQLLWDVGQERCSYHPHLPATVSSVYFSTAERCALNSLLGKTAWGHYLRKSREMFTWKQSETRDWGGQFTNLNIQRKEMRCTGKRGIPSCMGWTSTTKMSLKPFSKRTEPTSENHTEQIRGKQRQRDLLKTRASVAP